MAVRVNNKQEQNPTVLTVAKEYVRKPNGAHNLIISPTLKVLKWAEWWSNGLSEAGKSCKALLGKCSHSIMLLDIPKRIHRIKKISTQMQRNLMQGVVREIPKKSTQLFVETSLTAGLVADTVEILRQDQFITLNATQMIILNSIGFLGSTALFLKAAQRLKKQIHIIRISEFGSPQFNLSLLRIIGKICLMAVGFFGMTTFLIGAVISQFLLLSISTTLLITTISAHFYEKLCVKKKEKPVEL